MHVPLGRPVIGERHLFGLSGSFLLVTALVGALWLSYLQWPVPPNTELDPSWQAYLNDSFLQQRQFGRDVIFTFGPWGHVLTFFMMPAAVSGHLVLELVAKLLLAIYTVSLSRPLNPLRRVPFLLVACVIGPWMFDALIMLVTVALLLCPADRDRRVSARTSVAAAAALAFLSLVKFSNAILVWFGLGIVAAVRCAERRPSEALRLIAAYVAALAFFWIAAGQSLSVFPDFVTWGLEVAGGYPMAMSVEENWRIFLCGLGILAVHAAWLMLLAFDRPVRPHQLAVAAVLGASVFLSWKHGFTRADAHVLSFFVYSMLLALALPAFCAGRASRWWSPTIAVPLALLGMWLTVPGMVQLMPGAAVDRLRQNALTLIDIPAWRRSFDAGLAQSTEQHSFPLTRAAVGTSTIDVFGYQIGVALLNHLNYRPRPIAQSYAAYTPALLEANRAFLESPDAPQFLLGTLFGIDNRYAPQEDASWLAELPRRYEPVLTEKGHLLMKRRAEQPPPGPLHLTPLLEVHMRLGEELDLPPVRDHALWLQLDVDQTWLGRARGAVYKAPPLGLTVFTEQGMPLMHRVVPGIAQSGFIIQPVIETQSDLEGFVMRQGRTWARSLRLYSAEEHRRYWGQVRVRISRIDSIPLS